MNNNRINFMDPQLANKKIDELATKMMNLDSSDIDGAKKIQEEAIKINLYKIDAIELKRIELICTLSYKFGIDS